MPPAMNAPHMNAHIDAQMIIPLTKYPPFPYNYSANPANDIKQSNTEILTFENSTGKVDFVGAEGGVEKLRNGGKARMNLAMTNIH